MNSQEFFAFEIIHEINFKKIIIISIYKILYLSFNLIPKSIMNKIRLIMLVVMFGVVTISTNAQEKCKVLKADIAGEYSGDCKKGLANGEGISKGENTYEGKFKKGCLIVKVL